MVYEPHDDTNDEDGPWAPRGRAPWQPGEPSTAPEPSRPGPLAEPARPALPALPGDDLDAARKTQPKRALFHRVEDAHRFLWTDKTYKGKYRPYFYAVSSETAVTGSLLLDDGMAALMIQEHAHREGDTLVSGQRLMDLVHVLRAVTENYNNLSRKERKAAKRASCRGDEAAE